MTTIKLYGLLAKKFGTTIKLHLGNLNFLISAIDSIKEGFRKKIKDLSECGYNYVVEKDSNTNTIHIIPLIGGAGKTALIIVAIIVIIIAVIFTAGAALAGGAAAFTGGGTAAAGGVAATGSFATVSIGGIAMSAGFAAQVGLFLLSTGLSMLYNALTMPEMPGLENSSRSTGGATASSQAVGKSYIFTSGNNIATQGSSIPLGYGKMKIGSRLINFGIKNYPTSVTFLTEIENGQNDSIFSNYLSR